MIKKGIVALMSMIIMFGLSTVSVLAVTPIDGTIISRVTGKTELWDKDILNPNQTNTNYHVWGTDLGIMWDAGNGNIMIAFGDTEGNAQQSDWRSNTLAISNDTNPEDGLSFSTMIQDPPGRAKEILPSKKINGDEITVIPTAGVTVGSRHYIHYMSVNKWGDHGNWITNYSGIAYSDDDGQTWTKDPNTKWMNDDGGNSKFQQAAFIKDGNYVYMFSTENGRAGNIFLSRVLKNNVLNKSEYQYWNGNRWIKNDEEAAKPIVMGPAGEMSVAYNSYFDKWLMTYKNKDRAAIVLREANDLTGPWMGEKILKRGAALYGPYIHPWFNDGTDLYFNMTRWKPEYDVFFMKAELGDDFLEGNIISDPGFEEQDSSMAGAPWEHDMKRCSYCGQEGDAEIEKGLDFAYSGQNNVLVRGTNGMHAIKQKIVVEPNTDYTLKGWIRTSDNNEDGYFGARLPDGGKILNETMFEVIPDYTELTVSFDSGHNSIVEVYAGMLAEGDDTWIRVDDVSVIKGAPSAVNAKPTWGDNKKLTANNITGTGLTLSWYGVMDDNGVIGYTVYQDGELVDTITGDNRQTYDVTGLEANRIYTFKVEAIDENNLESTNGPTYTLGENLINDPGFEDQVSNGIMNIDNTSSSKDLVFNGIWNRLTQSGAYNNTVHVTSEAGDDMEFTFYGSVIRFFTKTGPQSGIMDIYIDGVKEATFDSYSKEPIHQVLAYENTNLSPFEEPHTIKVVNTGKRNTNSSGQFVHVDYFEMQSFSPWYSEGNAGIVIESIFARSGANNAWVHGLAGWNAIYQPIAVEPNMKYRITGWVQTSYNNNDGCFGIRLSHSDQDDRIVLDEVTFGDMPNYTKQTLTFDSGSNSLVEIYIGVWAHEEVSWIRMDDITLEVVVDFSSLRKRTERSVSHEGIAYSLNAKLNAAEAAHDNGNKTARNNQLAAFLKEIEAQTGKTINEEDAQILTWDVQQLMQR